MTTLTSKQVSELINEDYPLTLSVFKKVGGWMLEEGPISYDRQEALIFGLASYVKQYNRLSAKQLKIARKYLTSGQLLDVVTNMINNGEIA
jgi:hypothetical protein